MASRMTKPEYFPQGDLKALAHYFTRCRKAEGDIIRQGFPVTKGQIFWYGHPRRHPLIS